MDCVLKATDMTALSAALKPFVARDVVLCTDGSKAFAGAARELGVEHHAINLSAGIRVDGAWHIQNINTYHSCLKSRIYKFRGVTTCYLANYLDWFRVLERNPAGGQKPPQWLAMALGNVA